MIKLFKVCRCPVSESFRNKIESIASNYHALDSVGDKEFDQLFHRVLAQKITSNHIDSTQLLELGYGEGTVSNDFELPNLKTRIILEGSSYLAQQARLKLGQKAEVIEILFENYKPQVKFDLILATNVLEHVINPLEILNKIYDWLSDTGKCVITVPNSESVHRRLAVAIGLQENTKVLSDRDRVVGHLRVYDLATLTEEIRRANLAIVKQEGLDIKFLNNALQKLLPAEISIGLQKIAGEFPIDLAANLYLEVEKCNLQKNF